MLSNWVIILSALTYMGLLFGIAYYGDQRADAGRSIIANPYIYTLSIAVYCTAWTFYGSVGRAATTGVGFLPIYLGPTLVAVLFWFTLRRIVRITKVHRITSIADFIASRYGKSGLLGGLVTIIAVLGIMPYISIQLKAIAISYDVLRQYPDVVTPVLHADSIWADTSFYIALVLILFAILFGTRHIDNTERHEGLVAAVAFESLVKLLAFLLVGLFVTFGLFDGFGDLFSRAATYSYHPWGDPVRGRDAIVASWVDPSGDASGAVSRPAASAEARIPTPRIPMITESDVMVGIGCVWARIIFTPTKARMKTRLCFKYLKRFSSGAIAK